MCRYNKYSRRLPQTPWIIDGEKKFGGSVEVGNLLDFN